MNIGEPAFAGIHCVLVVGVYKARGFLRALHENYVAILCAFRRHCGVLRVNGFGRPTDYFGIESS
jgi:hypothetical protein